MQKKYSVEYSLHFRKHTPPQHYHLFADDAVEIELFVNNLLSHGMGLHAIRRDGAELPKPEFDRIVKIAAGEVASRLICTSLNIKPDEERFRFGFAG